MESPLHFNHDGHHNRTATAWQLSDSTPNNWRTKVRRFVKAEGHPAAALCGDGRLYLFYLDGGIVRQKLLSRDARPRPVAPGDANQRPHARGEDFQPASDPASWCDGSHGHYGTPQIGEGDQDDDLVPVRPVGKPQTSYPIPPAPKGGDRD